MLLGAFKSKLTCSLLCGLFLASSIYLDASSLPKPVGPLQRISPIPGPANPDPILANLPAVMDNWFQLPLYPALPHPPVPPGYLGGIIAQFNSFLCSGIALNPINDKTMITSFIINRFRDRTGTYVRFSAYGINARSKDGGFSWIYGPAASEPIPLGGTISQVPGFDAQQSLQYSKDGTLYTISRSRDLQPNPPNQIPLMRLLFSKSKDNGKTWSPPLTLFIPEVDQIFARAVGLTYEGLGMLPDPANAKLIHVTFPSLVYPSTFYGNMFYLRSEDGGKTFSSPVQVYSMMDDPVWLEEHFDPDFTSDPNYFIYGGQSWCAGGKFLVVDENVLLIPIFRLYPKIGATTYTQDASDSIMDHAVVRSLDNGKTWCPIAGATRQHYLPYVHDPAFEIGEVDFFLPDGSENNLIVYSPLTGRVYRAYMANNPNADPDFLINQFYPYILLSTSSDKGATWSDSVQINLTPTNIPRGNQQAFQPALEFTQDGSLVVGYYDFRNYTGGSDSKTFLQTDAWMAVYKETSDPKGGSTGVGLDVVGEIRLTPHSFDARVLKNSNFNAFAGLGAIGFAVNKNNELLVNFNMAGEASSTNITTGYKGMTIDTNNRVNVFLQRYKFPKPSNQ